MNHLTAHLQKDHSIIFLGDIHLGLKASSPHVFTEAARRVQKDKNTYICLMGDMVEARASDHPYYDVAAADKEKPLPVQQALHLKGMLEPIADRVLCALIGNHEYGLIRKLGNIYKSLVYDPLKIPYGGFSCRLSVRDKHEVLLYKIFLAHGFGTLSTTADDPVRRRANLILALKRKLKNKAGDCVVMGMGHCHKLLASEPSKMLYLAGKHKLEHRYLQHGQTEDFIHPDFRRFFCSGSSLRTFMDDHETYSELGGFDPVELGFTQMEVTKGVITNIEEVVL